MFYFNLHTHNITNQPNTKELINQYPDKLDTAVPYYSIGIHPWYIVADRIDSDLKIIESKLQDANCLAVGECGLDKRIQIQIDLQQSVFESQLLLAQQYKKPVIIHCVSAFQEVIALKKQLKITVPIIIHGFSKNEQIANQLIDNGFYLSFGKYLVNNPNLKTVFQNIPNDKFFLETDTLEIGIADMYILAGKYKNCSLEVLQQQIKSNFTAVFKMQL